MKKTPLRKVSPKQRVELERRRVLKAELIAEHGEYCMICNDRRRDWRGITLAHIVPLSRGGETTRENTDLECYPCHDYYEKRPELRQNKV